MHLQRDMVVTSELYGVRALGVREDDVSYSAGKLFFAYGLGNSMTFPLWTGSTAVLDDRRPTPDTTFETIEPSSPRSTSARRRSTPPSSPRWKEAARLLERPRLRLGGRGAARRHLPSLEGEDGTVILDGIGSTSACTSPSATGSTISPGHQRQAGAGNRPRLERPSRWDHRHLRRRRPRSSWSRRPTRHHARTTSGTPLAHGRMAAVFCPADRGRRGRRARRVARRPLPAGADSQ